MLNFIKNISTTELLAIALIFIVFFGAKAVTKIGKLGGETLKEVKNIKKSFSEAVEDGSDKKEVSN